MTYEATVQFKFDATFTHTYGSFLDADDYIPEEHYLITAPASDLNAKQYFKLFEKFMLCVVCVLLVFALVLCHWYSMIW